MKWRARPFRPGWYLATLSLTILSLGQVVTLSDAQAAGKKPVAEKNTVEEQAPAPLAPVTPQILTVPFTGTQNAVSRVAWFVPNHTAPVISLQMQFPQAGFAYDPADRQGLAFLAAQLLMEGAGKYDAVTFQKMLDANAIQLSADVDEDMLTLHVTMLRDRAEIAFALLREVLGAPRFDAEAVARLQARITNDLKRLSENPSYLAGQLWRRTVYLNHPYRQSKRGDAASIAAITREELLNWRKAHLTIGQVQISLSGDANEEEVQRWLVPAAMAMPAEVTPTISLAQAVPTYTPKPLVQPFTSPQTQFIFSYPALPRKDPQFLTLLVLNQILGGQSMGSRLTQAIRDQHGLAYSVSTVIDTNAASSQLMGFFSTRNAKAAAAFSMLMEQMRQLAQSGVTVEEVESAKSYLIGSLPVQLDGTGEMTDFLATLQRHGLPRDYFATRNARIAAVSPEAVAKLASRLLAATPMVVAVGDPEGRLSFDASAAKNAAPATVSSSPAPAPVPNPSIH